MSDATKQPRAVVEGHADQAGAAMRFRDLRRSTLVAATTAALLACSGCLPSSDDASSEEIDQLRAETDAVAEDVLAGIALTTDYEVTATRVGYRGCDMVSPPARIEYTNTHVLTSRTGSENGILSRDVVTTLEDEGWEVETVDSTTLRVAADDVIVTVELHVTAATTTADVTSQCLSGDRDVIEGYVD
ncbi:hypothetical protein [Nocardioides zeae]